MNRLEGYRILDDKRYIVRDSNNPENIHIRREVYIEGTHTEIPNSRPHKGWSGDEMFAEEDYYDSDCPLKIKDENEHLIEVCSWDHAPGTEDRPEPPSGWKYTDGICRKWMKILLESRQKRQPATSQGETLQG